MNKSLSQLEATQAVASALQRHIADLEQQRDAALKLADDWEKWELYCIEIKNPNIGLVPSQAANELRAIFEPKNRK